MDNPLEGLGNIDFGPAAVELVQAYLGAHSEAKIAITNPSAGKIMLTYMILSSPAPDHFAGEYLQVVTECFRGEFCVIHQTWHADS
jgi:hypothetical protein